VRQLAADYRAKRKRDVVVDVVCCRPYGHNETDQPAFTQPRMHKAIEKQPTPLTQYTKQLAERGTFAEKDIDEHKKRAGDTLEQASNAAKDYVLTSKEWLSSLWQGFPTPKEHSANVLAARSTGTDEQTLKTIGRAVSLFPERISCSEPAAVRSKPRCSVPLFQLPLPASAATR
jgi:2-oxoglutarate dehydrogenase E1 component